MKWRKLKNGTGSPWFLPSFTGRLKGWKLDVTGFSRGWGGDLAGYYFFATRGDEVFNSAWEKSGQPTFQTIEGAMLAAESWVNGRPNVR